MFREEGEWKEMESKEGSMHVFDAGGIESRKDPVDATIILWRFPLVKMDVTVRDTYATKEAGGSKNGAALQ